jgi:uncharacterized protein (TIGR03083 family)
MKKSDFISKIEATYQEYQTVLASVSEAQMLQPGACGEWSVKDAVAHVTWYEREMVGVLQKRSLLGSDHWNKTLEQRNAAIFGENEKRPLPDILAEARVIHQLLMELLRELSQEDLLESSHFREMPPDWIPWQVIASNTFEHYPDHTTDIRKAFHI